jgi:hypothetical protein
MKPITNIKKKEDTEEKKDERKRRENEEFCICVQHFFGVLSRQFRQ